METTDYLKMLTEDFHSAAVATVAADGKPQTRIIDIMLWDKSGVYFLTAKGKEFYSQITEQNFIALSAVKDKRSISLRGKMQNIGDEKLDKIFEKNAYMQSIYPGNTRSALEVFRIYEAQGEYFDISDPSNVLRNHFTLGTAKESRSGYYVGSECIGCRLCYSVCPQKCIDITRKPVIIDQHRCLHCGSCAQICPKQTIRKADRI